METKKVKKNLLYKLGSKRERVKLQKNAGIRGEGQRRKIDNCINGCT
jgi:hypothetical protein